MDTNVNRGCVAQLVDGIEWMFSKSVLVHISYVKNISAVIQMLEENKLGLCTNHALHFFFLPLKLVTYCCFIFGPSCILLMLFEEN